MARADILTGMVKTGASGDKEGFQRYVEALIAEEKQKRHMILADRLSMILKENNGSINPKIKNGHDVLRLHEQSRNLLFSIEPQRRLEDLFLTQIVRTTTEEIIQEHQRRDVLRSFGLMPRNKILLSGSPGNGKTSYAEALAEKLMLPLYVVRYESLITSYLGETSTRLQNLFDFVRQENCVLFFDEFDTIGKERGDTHETGEIKRVVSSLLLQIDRLPSQVIVVTASNHPELLDRAVWRRFDLNFKLEKPSLDDRVAYISRFFDKRDLNALPSVNQTAEALGDISYAELEQFCTDILRKAVLMNAPENIIGVAAHVISQWVEKNKNAASSK